MNNPMLLMPLAVAFSSQLASDRLSELASIELQVILEGLVADCRRAWPEVQIDPEAFVRYLAVRVSPARTIREALDSLHVSDLYLACGCVMGDSKAIAALDGRYIAAICGTSLSRRAGPGDADELAQRLRVRTLVADGATPPRIASYSGRGPLGKWIQVAATRLAADLRRVAAPRFDAAWSSPAVASDAERSYVQERYGDEFGKALESALARLTKKARMLLQLHFLEEVGVTQIAQRYGVSPRTVQRRIAAAENQVIEDVRSVLAQRLDLSTSQLESMLPDVETELMVALGRFFSSPGQAGSTLPPQKI